MSRLTLFKDSQRETIIEQIKQKFKLGNATFLFWLDKGNKAIDKSAFSVYSFHPSKIILEEGKYGKDFIYHQAGRGQEERHR